MIDPIGAFEEIRENFILYIKTAFGTKFPSLEAEREALLRRNRVLTQEPWIEPLPRYISSGKKIANLTAEDLPGLNETNRELFKSLVSCGLFGDYEMHAHQAEMLFKVLKGHNCVVTAGTGSGKTESFLLPLFAQLSKEITGWQAPGQPHANLYDWWSNERWKDSCKNNGRLTRSYRIPQRSHETRPSAVKALILYPMNALVEDQLTRLRKALDSDTTRQWYEENAGGNRIYMGRYNSSTPVPGHEIKRPTQSGRERLNKEKIDKLIESMKEIEGAARAVSNYASDPEKRVRKMLTALGCRYRLNVKSLPGKPDIVLRKYNSVIFVHGCFWHLHSSCRDGTIPKTRTEYWQEKLLKNKERDARNIKKLKQLGWRVLRLWECEIEKNPDEVIRKIKKFLIAE